MTGILRNTPPLVFGAKSFALKTGVETLRGVKYKLRMMGVHIDGPTYIYGGNRSVINNTLKSESVPKKNSTFICYRFVWEVVATKECLTSWLPTLSNYADLMTKVFSGKKRRDWTKGILHYVYDNT